ncbi:asparagine synthase-related protein [Marinilabilia rubra]|uniref:asparagine synthase (glutamine-hydrolyzing) n=1 Tax=Marinilabilia rubra TaxID=2162893 RepID=A0A2U2B948_9BACT|nr:asparagine synthase-related protein [Marinilabilia rubra]PWD99564.1 hypothetical protein DDZ16_08905 [Marinilabilia rubra]
MTSKIAGFVLSQSPLKYLPKLNPDLSVKTISGKWGYLYLYSMDKNIAPIEPGVWSLGFPPHKSLLHHNLLLTIEHDNVLIDNDWIGGIPVYFNSEEKIISTFPEVCIGNSPRFDDEGVYLFMKYGFSAFGKTPFADVSMMRYYSSIKFSEEGLTCREKEDPALSVDLSVPAKENEIWDLLEKDIINVLDQTSGTVVSPLSGGFDSRIINALIPCHYKSRVRTYSYGISPDQRKSFESRIAKNIAERLNLKWDQIFLKDAYKYMDLWHDAFGFGTHLHGMMHIEFYQKILQEIDLADSPLLLSGISGSAFQGGHPPEKSVTSPSDLYGLALTHGINSYHWMEYRETEAEARFFEQNKPLFSNLKWYPILTMRIKMSLLHYLYKLPAVMGISSTSPYHNFDIVTKMLSLPGERRDQRKWVNDFFKKKDLYVGNRSLYGDTRNTLNRQLFSNFKFEPLNENLLKSSPIPDELVKQVNRNLNNVGSFAEKANAFFTSQRVVKELLKPLGIKNRLNTYLPSYLAFKALEETLRKHQ